MLIQPYAVAGAGMPLSADLDSQAQTLHSDSLVGLSIAKTARLPDLQLVRPDTVNTSESSTHKSGFEL
jgi:hypothetical protein